jgi:hypothetical protein
MQRIGALLVVIAASACSGGDGATTGGDEPTTPLAGSFRGTTFGAPPGAAAVRRNGSLYVSLTSESIPCGDARPRAGWTIVNVSIPEPMQKPGSYALGSSTTRSDVPGVTVSRYEATPTGAPSTNSVILTKGTLWVKQASPTSITAAVATETQNDTSARGVFTAPICAGDGGVP